MIQLNESILSRAYHAIPRIWVNTMELSYKALKARHRLERAGYPTNLSLRVHRALSWLNRAEQMKRDQDGRFIFLWIAFNAAYANEIVSYERYSEQRIFGQFFQRICEMDTERKLYEMLWDEFAGSIRVLLDNRYVFQPFWDFCNGKLTSDQWRQRFRRANSAAQKALASQKTPIVLSIVFSRLYTLRNQIIHGGATWDGQVNRDQIRDGVHILDALVPNIIETMMNHPDEVWGDPIYPVIEE